MKKLFALLALALVLAPVVVLLISSSTTPEVVEIPAGGEGLIGLDPDITAPASGATRFRKPATPVAPVAPVAPRLLRQPRPVASPWGDRPEPAPTRAPIF